MESAATVPRVIRPQARIGVGLLAAMLVIAAPAAGAKPAKRALPDLVVAKVSKPPTATAGSQLSLDVQVRNKGRGAAGKSSVGVYLATGKKHTAKDPRLLRANVKPLRAGKSAQARLKVTLPVGAAGAHRLIVCADDAHGVRESKEGDNCTASAGFAVAAAAPAPAFSMTDGIDWGFVEGFNGTRPDERDPVTVSLRAANGLPGQGGYTRSTVAPQALLTGATTSLDFTGSNNSGDDGAVNVILPFAFPFGGVEERSVSVGSNGWISFDGPASDRWDNNQLSDYRGPEAVVANFERAIMPYWGDLELNDGQAGVSQSINEVVAPDGSYVAFQWDVEEFSQADVHRRLQLVLFPDGRFRFDYPGENKKGNNKAFVGYSLGTGGPGLDTVALEAEEVPTTSILFTPKPVPTAGPAPAGQATLALPPDSRFITGDPGCSVTVAPTATTAGTASCPVAALAAGQQVTRTVVFAMPHDAPGISVPADVHFSGAYVSGGVTLTGTDEIDRLSGADIPKNATIEVVPAYTSPPTPKVGTPSLFTVKVTPKTGALVQPGITFTLPGNTTLVSVQAKGGAPLNCGPVAGAQISCQLPDGLGGLLEIEVKVTPSATAAGAKMTLEASAQAVNAPPASGKSESPAVEP